MTGPHRTAAFAAVLSLGCILPLAAVAISARAVSLDAESASLARRADVIAFGTCQSAESNWDDQHRFIVTTVQFRPTRSFKGAITQSLTIKILGGQIGSEGMTASHSAAMSSGEDAVFFLQHSSFGDYYIVTGGAEGKLSVRADAGSGLPMIRGAVSLDDFGRWVSELLRAQ